MVQVEKILSYLDSIFNFSAIGDVAYNGLQFEGTKSIKRIVTGVDCCAPFLQTAINLKADLAIVHHGVFWKGGEWKHIGPIEKRMVSLLLEGDLNLVSLHLPLDFHTEFGNNNIIAKGLGAKPFEDFADFHGQKIGVIASFEKELQLGTVIKKIEKFIGPLSHHLNFGPPKIKRIGIVSGGGWSSISDPHVTNGGIDALLTGEVIHQAFFPCQARKIHLFAAGHYATETFGVKALGEHLSKKFNITHNFISQPTGL